MCDHHIIHQWRETIGTIYLVQGVPDMQNDADVGFEILTTDDIDEIGTAGIVKLIRDRVGDQPVYLRCGAAFPPRLFYTLSAWDFPSQPGYRRH